MQNVVDEESGLSGRMASFHSLKKIYGDKEVHSHEYARPMHANPPPMADDDEVLLTPQQVRAKLGRISDKRTPAIHSHYCGEGSWSRMASSNPLEQIYGDKEMHPHEYARPKHANPPPMADDDEFLLTSQQVRAKLGRISDKRTSPINSHFCGEGSCSRIASSHPL